jgi:DNA replication protein DnaC
MIDHREEQIKLLAKQLKLPTFANYMDILRQAKADADFSDLLLDLLLAEASARQENQNRRRLKAAAFPYQKTLDDFDFSQLAV